MVGQQSLHSPCMCSSTSEAGKLRTMIPRCPGGSTTQKEAVKGRPHFRCFHCFSWPVPLLWSLVFPWCTSQSSWQHPDCKRQILLVPPHPALWLSKVFLKAQYGTCSLLNDSVNTRDSSAWASWGARMHYILATESWSIQHMKGRNFTINGRWEGRCLIIKYYQIFY